MSAKLNCRHTIQEVLRIWQNVKVAWLTERANKGYSFQKQYDIDHCNQRFGVLMVDFAFVILHYNSHAESHS